MVLKSSMLIQEWTSWNCGISRYLANSACHAASLKGGRMPDIGCHSVIDSPDSVSLVTPPSTTMTRIIAAQTRSQTAMARRLPAATASTPVWGRRSIPLIMWPEADDAAANWQAPACRSQARLHETDRMNRAWSYPHPDPPPQGGRETSFDRS